MRRVSNLPLRKPADYVVFEAESAEDANRIALKNGVYFDGIAQGRDCQCCGDRWSRVAESAGMHECLIDGQPIVEYKPRFLEIGRLLTALIVPAEGEPRTIIVGSAGKQRMVATH